MVTSIWAANLVWILLLLNWLLEGRWTEKWRMARESRLLHAFLVLYLMHVIGLLWTSNMPHGLEVLQVKLPLLFVPTVMLTSRPVEGTARRNILWFYGFTVMVVSIIGVVRLLTIPDLPYRYAVPYISHIRFALNCCMVICLCLHGIGHSTHQLRYLLLLPVVWMLAFILLLHSYTAVVVLAVVSLLILLLRWRRWPLIALWAVLAGGLLFMTGYEIKSYYRLVPMAQEPLQAYTAGGRPYTHACDGIIENGNYINNYLCREEMRAEWTHRSTLPYDSLTASGYSVESTLTRYLNALGLTKDSVGVNTLTDNQIADIEEGVANPVYRSHNPIRKMVYVMLLEREFHRHTHASAGFTMLQRFEMWGTTLHIVGQHPWLGVGTGDVDDELQAALFREDSELAGSSLRSHNQYLSLLAAFGVVGLLLLAIFFLRATPAMRYQPALLLALLFTILISCLTEDTLDTLAGQLFCLWFIAFRQTPCTNTTH